MAPSRSSHPHTQDINIRRANSSKQINIPLSHHGMPRTPSTPFLHSSPSSVASEETSLPLRSGSSPPLSPRSFLSIFRSEDSPRSDVTFCSTSTASASSRKDSHLSPPTEHIPSAPSSSRTTRRLSGVSVGAKHHDDSIRPSKHLKGVEFENGGGASSSSDLPQQQHPPQYPSDLPQHPHSSEQEDQETSPSGDGSEHQKEEQKKEKQQREDDQARRQTVQNVSGSTSTPLGRLTKRLKTILDRKRTRDVGQKQKEQKREKERERENKKVVELTRVEDVHWTEM